MIFQEVRFLIQGMTPLMMSNPQAMMLVPDEGEIKRTKIKAKPTREEQAELAAYRHEDGTLVFPAIAFRNGLLSVATSYKPPKSKKSMAHYVAHVRPTEEYVPILNEDGLPISDYIIDTRKGVNNNCRPPAGIVLHRPKINSWQVNLGLLYHPDFIGVENPSEWLQKLLNDAGALNGVGAFRPQKKGWFGMYQVKQIL